MKLTRGKTGSCKMYTNFALIFNGNEKMYFWKTDRSSGFENIVWE